MRPKRHFALKDTFPVETTGRKQRTMSQNFQNFAKFFIFHRKKKGKKKCRGCEKKKRCRGAAGATFFFSIILLHPKIKKQIKKYITWLSRGGVVIFVTKMHLWLYPKGKLSFDKIPIPPPGDPPDLSVFLTFFQCKCVFCMKKKKRGPIKIFP